ncbi:putative lipid II flippase FtsW [Alkalibacter saccharofermentans]|uniref:Probable peptidoglycan glycosyltransferase FtsW n=1 Tax=Alkalibacter saccharofermentans DSM 14828 TaxID=1120975 RepID=A0A1M4UHL6_9FIRM|nr:putative lipid II flippase FtsW [Alkalibacter saccharofermentans]SHE56053.1 cell division protein FtsW [Alkalibacter saccharofermentans DSM 14828]
MKKIYPSDFWITFSVIALTCVGVVMVFSASIYQSSALYDDQYAIFRRQLIYSVLGIFVMLFVSRIDYKIYKRFALPLLGLSFILLVLVFVPGIGYYANGAYRWIRIGGLTLQTSEVAKITIIIFMAASLSCIKEDVRKFFSGFVPYLILMGVFSGIIYLQPNLSTAIIIACLILGMLFVAGGNMLHLGGLFGGVVSIIVYLIASGWRRDRLEAFLSPEANITGSGWQSRQSILALGSGGVFGQGLGNGKQKMFFLPEPQNDFIFAHIGEELGLIGTLLILVFFLVLIWRGVNVAVNAPDSFSSLLAFGLILMIGLQVVINIAVVAQLIPVTGIPLPFISAGGTSVVFLMGGMGILLNISRHVTPKRRQK